MKGEESGSLTGIVVGSTLISLTCLIAMLIFMGLSGGEAARKEEVMQSFGSVSQILLDLDQRTKKIEEKLKIAPKGK